MTDSFAYSTTFKLDKSHFSECYQESVVPDYSLRAYSKAIFLALMGLGLSLFTEIDQYAAWFLIGLGVVEALSVKYQKPWWLARQMLSRSANSQVTLTIDGQGIRSKSVYVDALISWGDINQVSPTGQGLLVIHKGGRSYISSRCLSEEATGFIHRQLDGAGQNDDTDQ
ncbi:YcxB family protein [Thalassomonas actiniarum]|uniref:YcxB family protein n=1 Tax=Thalassomonas actiniarum TaxID=485447 RepID=A0AAF0C307_9GAMM|nr:YcxB family protein [Thalassomonas actiniarum]WDD98468.1 YcxB family protein [Thalassomonas actiniarum]